MWMSTLGSLPETVVCPASGSLPSYALYGCVVVAMVLLASWALLERRERRICMKQSISLSDACHQLTEQHYRERVQAEERHLLSHDSTVRNVLESLERALLGRPRS